jgi:hypothetical protein
MATLLSHTYTSCSIIIISWHLNAHAIKKLGIYYMANH